MADGISVDASEMGYLSRSLGEVSQNAGRYIRQATEVSARKVKDAWRLEAAGITGAKRFPYSITYDIETVQFHGVSVVQAEIGPDKSIRGRQGPLGNLIEYGGDTRGGLDSRRGVGAAVLKRTGDDFEKGLSIALEHAEHAAGVDASVVASAGAVIRGSYR